MLPGIFLIKNGARRLAEERSQGILLDTIGDHLVSMNRFEEAFGPSQPHKDPKKAKQQRTVSLSNASTMKEMRALLGAVPHWVKIAGKNGFSLSTERGKEVIEAISPERIDAIIAHLDLHWPGAGFVFDGDTNEESAPFTQALILLPVNSFTFPLGFLHFFHKFQVIKELIVRGRVVASFGTQETESVTLDDVKGPRYEVWGDLVSDSFVKSWTTAMPRAQQTCSPCRERPNFCFGLLDYLFAKETLTRTAVAGTVFVGSALPDFQLNTKTGGLTTGYTELVRLLSEPSKDGKSFANFVHELNAPKNMPPAPPSKVLPGLVVVVHHGVAGTGVVSPTYRITGPMPSPRMTEDAAVAKRLDDLLNEAKDRVASQST